MKSTIISSLVFVALLSLVGATKHRESFVGTFVIDEGTWEREARAAVEQKKVALTWSVEDMAGWIRYVAAVFPSVEIKQNGTYVQRSAFFGAAYGRWQLKSGALMACPDKVQTGIWDQTFRPVRFSISLNARVYRYAEGGDGPSDLPLKPVEPE